MKRLIRNTIILSSLFFAAACVVHHPHHHKIKAKTVKAVISLDEEHSHSSIVIVNIEPAKNRKCRKHNNHWHCKK